MNRNSKSLYAMYSQMGFDDAPDLAIKAESVMFIRAQMDKRKMTQKALAVSIGWTTSRLSDLLRGRLDLFSHEKINEALAPFGRMIRNHPKLEKVPTAKPQHKDAA